MKGKRVVVTRPLGYNAELTRQLQRAGYEVLERPLLSIKPLATNPGSRDRVMDLDRYDVIVFVSRNAVVFGMPQLQDYWPAWPDRLRWYAVGPGTARELQKYEVRATYPEIAGAQGLIDLADWRDVERVLIVRGRGGLELLREYLVEQLIRVDYLEVYERVGTIWPELAKDVADDGLDVVVLTSGEAIEPLCESLNRDVLVKLNILVPTERIRDIAMASGFTNIQVTHGVSDEAVLAALSDRENF